jgi:hypothetical protein
MEDLLKTHKALEECYKGYTLDQVRQTSASELKSLCLQERLEHAKNLTKLDIKNLIDERISIIKDQYLRAKDNRREELKTYFKY